MTATTGDKPTAYIPAKRSCEEEVLEMDSIRKAGFGLVLSRFASLNSIELLRLPLSHSLN